MKRAAFALCLTLALTAAPASAADSSSSLFIYRESDLGRESHLFRSGVDQVVATDARNPIEVMAWAPDQRHASVRLAPPGQTPHVGVYRDARWIFSSLTQPGMFVARDGETDGSLEGNFAIKDIAFSPSGQLQRLWAIFEERCTCGAPYTFGEVRLGMPKPEPSMELLPTTLSWPPTYLGRGGVAVPVTLVAASGTAVRPAQAAIAGGDASEFEVTRDDCSGRTIPAGGTCELWVRFDPLTAGAKTAFLEVRDASGASHRVPLEGRVAGGRTRLVMTSGPNNWVGSGRDYSYSPLNSDISIDGVSEGVSIRVRGRLDQGDWWNAWFDPPAGRKLVPGHFPNATRWSPADEPGARMEVDGQGRGCNTLRGDFTVEHSAFAPDGRLTELGVSFAQYCDTDTDPLEGRFEYHVGGSTPPFGAGLQSGTGTHTGSHTGSPGTEAREELVRGPAACGKRQFPRHLALSGTRRRDKITGTGAGELLRGGRGDDRVRAAGGSDCLSGGPGRDALRGGPGSDVLVGGPGRDHLNCGPGRDLAVASGRDVVRGCERVR